MKQSGIWPKAEEIRRVEGATAESFTREFVARPRPVVLSGLMEGWAAPSAWTTEHLTSLIGDLNVTVSVAERHTFDPSPEKAYADINRPMKFREYVQLARLNHLETSRYYYKAGASLRGDLARLNDDLDFFQFFDRRRKLFPWVWFSPAGTVTPLHKDPVRAHNFHALVRGRKRFVLFGPDDEPFLYPYVGRIPHFSQVDVDSPDLEKFPDLPKATPWHCVLEAGEILHIPDGWWHHVTSLEDGISVNVWWLESFFKKRWGGPRRRGGAGAKTRAAA